MGGIMGVFWILVVLVAVVALLVFLFRGAGSRPGPRAGDESPEDILKKRYARGEIGREEYERKLEDLRRS